MFFGISKPARNFRQSKLFYTVLEILRLDSFFMKLFKSENASLYIHHSDKKVSFGKL